MINQIYYKISNSPTFLQSFNYIIVINGIRVFHIYLNSIGNTGNVDSIITNIFSLNLFLFSISRIKQSNNFPNCTLWNFRAYPLRKWKAFPKSSAKNVLASSHLFVLYTMYTECMTESESETL